MILSALHRLLTQNTLIIEANEQVLQHTLMQVNG